MNSSQPSGSLDAQRNDYVASAARAALGSVPFVGSLLVEIAGTVIPNQRIDRIARFAGALEEKLRHLERDFVRSQLSNENFTDLIEEGLRQAARSLSDERREYIASLIANSLTSEDIEYQESKHLLRILAEIKDVEVIWLRFFLVPAVGGDEEFRDRHKVVLQQVQPVLSSPREVLEQAALQNSYKEYLAQLGLLERRYRADRQTNQPVFDRNRGTMEVTGYEITGLGELVLRQVGLTTDS